MYQFSKNHLLIGVAVLAVLMTGGLVVAKMAPGGFSVASFMPVSPDAVAKKAVDYINANKDTLTQGQTVALESFSKKSGLIKIKIKIGTSSFDSYVTADGKLLFPKALSLDAAPATK